MHSVVKRTAASSKGAEQDAEGGSPQTTPAAPSAEPTFDELHRGVQAKQPRRGTVTQPPSAWQPDEVTLGFAMRADAEGHPQELPETIVLATILVAVENERRRLLHVLTGGGSEEVEAVANVYWPLIIRPGRTPDEVAIFDGTGVWRRTFRYTLLPPMDRIHQMLDRRVPPAEFAQQARGLLPFFGHDPGAELLNVEGFLPVDPPLLFDVLSHSEFRSEPQVPHAGFLPARHDVAWYRDVVEQMRTWLDRFSQDLASLGAIRTRFHDEIAALTAQLEAEYRQAVHEGGRRVDDAVRELAKEVDATQTRYRQSVAQHAEEIRRAQVTIARAEATKATTDALAMRATHRRTDADAHVARGKDAEQAIRQAQRAIAEHRHEIEELHARERAELERLGSRIVDLEREQARQLSERELFRDEFLGVGSDLLQAIDGQISARSMQKNLLAGYFLPLPSLAPVRVIWFPLWTATLRGPRGIRQLVFPPMQVRAEKGLAGTLKSIFGGVVLPLEPRTAQFDKVLRTTMEESLQHDPWLSVATQELTRAADVLTDPDLLHKLDEGLGQLEAAKWITSRQRSEFRKAYADRAHVRAAAGGAPDLPRGVGAEPYRPAPPGPSGPPDAPG